MDIRKLDEHVSWTWEDMADPETWTAALTANRKEVGRNNHINHSCVVSLGVVSR